MEVILQLLNFIFGLFLIVFGFKIFKNSKEIYLKRKDKKYSTAYEKWANEKNTPIFIKFSSVGIILFGIALNFIVLYNLFF